MEEYKQAITDDAKNLLGELPKRVINVQTLLQQHFQARLPSVVRAKFTQVVQTTPGKIPTNAELNAQLMIVGDEVELLLTTLQRLQVWIQLLVPKVEDGNNFGVEVQKYAFTHIKESIAIWQKTWDSLAEYYSQRAATIEKINEKIANEKSSSTTVTTTTGAKDGDESKTVTTQLAKETGTANSPVEDWLAHVVALDMKWYFNLAHALEGVRDQYAVTFDIIEKNKDKIQLPRGSNDRRGYNMF